MSMNKSDYLLSILLSVVIGLWVVIFVNFIRTIQFTAFFFLILFVLLVVAVLEPGDPTEDIIPVAD